MPVHPKFSVVIPTYNQADFLKIALRSVLDQTLEDFEVIVVNNHSTDHTLDVVREAQDSRLRSIDFRNNGVIGASRNVGIKASEAPYIAFLDSDDFWYEDKLATIAGAIENDPEAGLFCHDQEIIRDDKVSKNSHYGPPDGFHGDLSDYLMLVGNCVATSATSVAKQFVEEVGYFSEEQNLITVEDYDLWVRMSKVCRFKFIHQVLGKQRYHPASSSSNAELHLRSTLAILEKHRVELQQDDQPYPKSAMRMRRAKAYFGAARQYHRRGSLKKALGHYARTFRTHPFYLHTYAASGLLLADALLGQRRRKKITDAFVPGV